MWRALGSEAAPPRLPRPRIGDRQALGLLLPLVALQAQIIEHERQHSEALLGQLCAVLRFNQRGRCPVARPVAVRTVALRWWVNSAGSIRHCPNSFFVPVRRPVLILRSMVL